MGRDTLKFDDDVAAWDVLKYQFGVTRGGVIYPYDHDKVVTPRQNAAIDYLFREWDYEFDPLPHLEPGD